MLVLQLPVDSPRQPLDCGSLRLLGKLGSPPRTAWGLRDVQDVLPVTRAIRLLGMACKHLQIWQAHSC